MALRILLALCALTAFGLPLEAQRPATTVVIVRHAEKDSVPADDPPLTSAGRARAKALADLLQNAGVGAIITTDLARSRETAAPLAAARSLTPIVVPRGRGKNVAKHARLVAAAVRRNPGKTVLVVAHSETIGPIIQALGGPAIPELCALEYSNVYTLVLETGKPARLSRSSYGTPSPPHRTPCATMAKP